MKAPENDLGGFRLCLLTRSGTRLLALDLDAHFLAL